MKAFISRFRPLSGNPRGFAPLIIDFCLLVQSTWTGRQLGPDLVYPLLSIRKRQSGRLARLILEHSRNETSYELHATSTFPPGIESPCVAVIDVDDVPHDIVLNGYTTQTDYSGLVCMLMCFQVIVALSLHVFYLWDQGWTVAVGCWCGCAFFNMIFFVEAMHHGDGTLTLARRSDTSTPGSAVLLDQDFAVVLNGTQGVVEAIAESGFNLSHCNFLVAETPSPYDILEVLCDTASFAVFVLCWMLLRPSTELWLTVPLAVVYAIRSQTSAASLSSSPQVSLWHSQIMPALFIVVQYARTIGLDKTSSPFTCQILTFMFSFFLLALCSAAPSSLNYPIQSTKFLGAIGHPRVRKWRFDTHAAAATFQCLILCNNIARPVRRIDVFGLLDMLVPDQRDIWKAWKERVADRIIHETDIDFIPTIPMFSDERQRQFKDLLDQAQFGYHAYRCFCMQYPHRERHSTRCCVAGNTLIPHV